MYLLIFNHFKLKYRIYICIIFQIFFCYSLLQDAQYKFPVLYYGFFLLIYFIYSSVYVFIPNS